MTAPASIRAELATTDGYWTDARLTIWQRMSPEARDHDRWVGWYPPGQGAYETKGARQAEEERQEELEANDHGCRCHIAPPCSHCVECTTCAEQL